MYRTWLRDPDYRVLGLLGYMQPSGALYWRSFLYDALIAGDVYDRPDIWTITILDRRWHFGECRWDFAPKKIEHQVRRALKGLNYLVMIEFEVFGNVRYLEDVVSGRLVHPRDQGRTIAPHIQGLVWGRMPSRQQRSQFEGGIFNAPGVTMKSLTNFAGAVRYMVKPPYKGQLIHVRENGRRVRYPWLKMPLTLHHLLFCNLFDYGYPDLTFGSGEGSAVLAQANRLWHDQLR